MRPGQLVGPLVMIALGVLFLIDNLVVDISFRRIFSDFWPLILIAAGFGQLVSGVLRGPARAWGHLAGGAVTITMGCLFQMQELGGPRFGNTWPVLLVVVGALGLVKALIGPAAVVDRAQRAFRGGFER